MNFLAFGPAQAVALWSVAAAVALWIYLHNRRPLRRRVSTLRFWASVQPVSQPRRRRLREPWALLAQLMFLLLLILALANPRWGGVFEGRSVVIVLDTSIWSQAQRPGESPWIDQVKSQAQRLLDALPSGDRVMLLPADADALPILPFTTNRPALRRAVAGAQPSSVVADVPGALEIGKAALGESRRGLLVYIGPGRLDEQQAQRLDEFRQGLETSEAGSGKPQFLVRLVGGEAPVFNRGITSLSLRRDATQPDRWRLLTQLKNYSEMKTHVTLKLSIDGQPLGQRTLSLAPLQLLNAEDEFVWDQGGMLGAEITPSDALAADDRAVVEVPSFRPVRVAVFAGNSPFAADLLDVLSSNPYVRTTVLAPGSNPDLPLDVAIYQGTSLPARPVFNSIYFLSGTTAASRPVRVTAWNTQHPVTRWVRTRDISIRNPAPLNPLPADVVLASAEGNPRIPLILAREENGHRILIIGFNPHDSNFPLHSAFPLLMAGALEWMTNPVDESAKSIATGELDVPGPVTRIVAPSGKEVAFARQGGDVHLLATETGMYRLIAPGGETVLGVNAPPLPSERLKPAPLETAGVESEPVEEAGWALWRWLALLAMVALWLEWQLYYSSRESQRLTEIREAPGDRELPIELNAENGGENSEARKSNLVA